MSVETNLGNFFKAEVKASGRRLLAEEKVSLTGGSDTTIHAYIRASPPLKVVLTSRGVASPTFIADCNCPAGKKAQFCKHVWGALLAVELKFPDFLSGKLTLEKPDATPDAPAENTYAEVAKARASEYRKEQYQRQKLRAKDQKRGAKARGGERSADSFPPEIAAALAYFELNGFPMPNGPDVDIVADAKRTLSRLFHPDRGGNHAEMVELNEACETLLRFLG